MSSHTNGDSKHSNGSRPGTADGAANEGEGKKKLSCLQKFSEGLMGFLEGSFSKLGYAIGKRPALTMVISLIVCGLCCIGMLAFNEETASEKLWVPEGSDVVDHVAWIDDNFPYNVIREQIIAVDSNILEAKCIKAMYSMYKDSLDMTSSRGDKLDAFCVGTPNCVVTGVLEVWSYQEAAINALTDAQVLADVQATTVSPTSGQPIEWKNYLGEISRDNNGDITGAKAAFLIWQVQGDDSMESRIESWEDKFISLGKKGHSDISSTYVAAGKTFQEEGEKALNSDLLLLVLGYILVVVFVVSVLGNFNFLEQRMWMTLGGFLCIGLSLLVSIGLASAFQQDYGPLQSILPFLLLGVGVDDMFVVIGALNNLSPEEQNCEIPELMAKVLGHAGVSITVTSLTDFVAFMVGASTIIPGLRSFCVYAAMGILGLYGLQATFFTACLAFDVKRIRANRDACLFCIQHSDDYEPTKCSQKQFIPFVFKKALVPIVTTTPFRVIVIVFTLGFFGLNAWGFSELEQYFNPNWFIPDDSYASKFVSAQVKYFPEVGDLGFMYCGELDYFNSKDKLEKLNDLMANSKYISNGTTDSWFQTFTDWLDTATDPAVTAKIDPTTKYPTTEANFHELLCQMTNTVNPRTGSFINYNTGNTCVPKATRFPFDHIDMDTADEEIDAMDDTFDLVTEAGFKKDDCFPFMKWYLTWNTNKVLKLELFRNLALAMLCVFIVGLILIADILTTLFVFLGVVFTLVDVGGTAHFWGLTIDTVTSVVLILSIGLAVDYSAHIGHMFMRIKGTRNDRVKETLREIGPPVFSGGFSTFLAFVMLSGSASYSFRTFFKVNFLVVLYGLYHGLIFLPVVLSLIGPSPYPNASIEYHDSKKNNQVDRGTTSANGMERGGPANANGVDNQGFHEEKNQKKGSEMTSLSNLPPLEPTSPPKHQQQSGQNSSSIDLNMSRGSSAKDGAEIGQHPDNPNVTVVRM